MKRFAIVLLGVVVVVPSQGEEPIPRVRTGLTEIPASYIALGQLIVAIDGTTYTDLISTVKNTLAASGAAQLPNLDSSNACFTYENIQITFSSDLMAGPDRFNAFTVEEVQNPAARCLDLPISFRPVRVGGWLAIGESRETIERRFQVTSDKSEAVIRYYFSGTVPGRCLDEGLGFGATLDLTYTAGKVTRLAGRQATAC